MISIAIIDDSVSFLSEIDKHICSIFQNYEYITHKFQNEVEFLNKVKNNEKYDIIILDIMLPAVDGLQIGRTINEFLPKSNIVFLSANPDFFQDVYYIDHIYFLIKPIDTKRLKNALIRCAERCNHSFVCVSYKGVLEKVYIDDIVCIESYLRNVIFHLAAGRKVEKLDKISNIEPDLPPHFVRCQKSYIINFDHVNKIVADRIYTSDKQNIAISRYKVVEIKEKYALYLGGEL